jgi:putative membrane protein
MQYLLLIFKGVFIGAANVMPGISGATLAVVMRVYDGLISSINNVFSQTKNSLKFLVPLGIGMGVGILLLGGALDWLFDRFGLQAVALIAGLMAGSVPFLHGKAREGAKSPAVGYAVAVIACAAIVLLELFATAPAAYPGGEFSVGFALWLFLGGGAAAAAMVIPGVSGAMVLMLFGLFPLTVHMIAEAGQWITRPTDFELLLSVVRVATPMGLGIVAGLLLCSRLVAFLLARWHSGTYFAIVGMVFGTVFVMWNNLGEISAGAGGVVAAVLLFIVGCVTALLLGK